MYASYELKTYRQRAIILFLSTFHLSFQLMDLIADGVCIDAFGIFTLSFDDQDGFFFNKYF